MNRTILISLSCLAALLPGLASAQSTNAAAPADAGSDTAAVAVPGVPDLGRDSFKALFQNNIFDGFRIKHVLRTNPPPVLRETLSFNGGVEDADGKDIHFCITAPGRGRMDAGAKFYGISNSITGTGLTVVAGDTDNVELQAGDGTSFKLTALDSLMRENGGPWHANTSYGMMNQDDTGGGFNGGGGGRGGNGGGRNNQRGGGRQRGGGGNNGGGFGGGGFGGNNGGYGGGFGGGNNGGYNNNGGGFGGGYNNGGYNGGGYNNGGGNFNGYNGGGGGGGGRYGGGAADYGNSSTSTDSGSASASSDSGSDSSTASSSSSSSSENSDSVIARLKAQREQN